MHKPLSSTRRMRTLIRLMYRPDKNTKDCLCRSLRSLPINHTTDPMRSLSVPNEKPNAMPTISRRGAVMPSSPIRKLAPLAAEAESRGVRILSLNIGQPDLPTPREAFEVLKHIDRTVLEYSPSDGYASIRKKFTEYYHKNNVDVRPDQIIVTSGGSESVLFSFLAALDPGDEVILPEPAYANYVAFSKTVGARIIGLPCSIDDGFKLPPIEEFEKRITPSTKAYPHLQPQQSYRLRIYQRRVRPNTRHCQEA